MKVKPTNKPGSVLLEMNGRDGELMAKSSGPRTAPFKIGKVLVPIDFSELSLKALEYAKGFSEKHGASLLLVHVIEPVLYPENYIGALPPHIEQVNIESTRLARKRLATIRDAEISPKTVAEVVVNLGRPWDEIIRAAKEKDVDLIVISTHGRTGLKHVFLGSTAERVVRHAPCPVLVVREREKDFVKAGNS